MMILYIIMIDNIQILQWSKCFIRTRHIFKIEAQYRYIAIFVIKIISSI